MSRIRDITYGHLLQEEAPLLIVFVPALQAILLWYHLSSMEIIFVNVEVLTLILTQALLSTTHYGMAMAVLAPVPAVNSTTLHGSVNSYLSLLQTTLRYV